MSGDLLIFELDGVDYAVPTTEVASIVEVERLPFIPGQRGLVGGMISLRGEPVAVVNLASVFSREPVGKSSGRMRGKVVVVGDKQRTLGLNIGDSKVSFIWKEGLKNAGITSEEGKYTSGRFEAGGTPVYFINWAALFEEAARILST